MKKQCDKIKIKEYLKGAFKLYDYTKTTLEEMILPFNGNTESDGTCWSAKRNKDWISDRIVEAFIHKSLTAEVTKNVNKEIEFSDLNKVKAYLKSVVQNAVTEHLKNTGKDSMAGFKLHFLETKFPIWQAAQTAAEKNTSQISLQKYAQGARFK